VRRTDRAHATKLLQAAQRGDPRARERVVDAHLPLVRAIALRYHDLGLPTEDLVQEGAIGLLDAIERFNPARDIEFATFAWWHVRRAILKALTEQSRLVRLPREVVTRRRALARADARLTAANGRHPTTRQLAAATGLPEAVVDQSRSALHAVVSLDGPAFRDGPALESVLPDPSSLDPEHVTEADEEVRLLGDALAGLPDRQRTVISRHFGLGCPEENINEVATDLALSAQRTRTIERDALYDLRTKLEEAGMRR
jgi:RNA polymerase sigma factor (sigma-70 family)